MAPDQLSIGCSHQYTSCWRSGLWLHRWKWVGRSRVWWWFMLAGQMCYFVERASDRDAWMSPHGLWESERVFHTNGLLLACWRYFKSPQSGRNSQGCEKHCLAGLEFFFIVSQELRREKHSKDFWIIIFLLFLNYFCAFMLVILKTSGLKSNKRHILKTKLSLNAYQ